MQLSDWHETGDRFSWRGQQVFYQEAGEGPVVFLLHGFITSSWIYKLIWPKLSQHFRLIAPDYIGFGFSSKPKDYDYGFDERVEMIYALAGLLSIDECHIMAQSFGVYVAQELLYRQLHGISKLHVQSVVMLNGALFADESTPGFRQKMMLTPFFGKFFAKILGRRAFKSALGRRVGKYSKFPDDLMDDLFMQLEHDGGLQLLHRFNQYLIEREERKDELESALEQTKVPIQLIWGIDKEDQVAGIRLAHKYRALRGDQYVVMLKDIGHFPMVECPDVVIEYFINFIKGLDNSSDNILPV